MELTAMSSFAKKQNILLSDYPGNEINLFLEQCPIAIQIVKGPEFTYMLANDKSLEIMGRSREQLIGRTVLDVIPELKDQPLYKILQQVYKTGETVCDDEIPVQLFRNGKLEDIYAKFVYQPLRDDNGNIFGIAITGDDITHQVLTRKKIEENSALLQKTKDQLELSISSGMIGLWHWDVKKNELTWSKEQLEIFGMTAEDFNGTAEDFFDLIIPEDRDKINAASRLEFERSDNQYDFRIRRKDGSIRWIQSRSRTFLDKNGRAEYITGINIDITEQKETEEKLHHAATLTQNIIDAVIGTDTVENNYRITSWNKGAEIIYGWKEEEVIGRPVRDIIYTSFSIEQEKDALISMKEKGCWEGEVVQKTKGGKLLDIHAVVAIVRDESGKNIGAVAVNRDITDKKIAEHRLRESEKRYKALTESTSSIVWTTDAAGAFTSPQSSWQQYTGQPWEEHQGWGWVNMLHETDRNRVATSWSQAVEKKQTWQSEGKLWSALHNDYRCFESKAVPLVNDKGKVTEWVGMFTDVDEQRMAEEKIRQSEERYRQLSVNLEAQVQQRTEELQEKNRQLNEAQEIAQLGSWEWNVLTNEVRWSDEMYRIYGYEEERFPVTYERATERMMPTDIERTRGRVREQMANAIMKFKESGSLIYHNSPAEYIITIPGGTKKFLRGMGQIIFSPDGNISRIVGTVQDITEQKKSEEKIKDINKRLNEAQEIAQVGNWEWNLATGELHWSDNLYNIYGLDLSEEMSFEKFTSLLAPGDRENILRIVEKARREKRFEEFFHRITTPAGEVKILHSRGEVITDKDGNIIKMIGTGQDVTKEKLTEEQLIETSRKFEERNHFVEKLINSSLDLVFVIDREFRFMTINKKAESVIREIYSGQIIGEKLTDINPNFTDSEAFEDIRMAFTGQIVIRDKAPSTIPGNRFYEHNYVPLQDQQGEVYAVMIISHDITQNIAQMEELKKLYESDKLKSDFIKMASHELKTPVTSIKGYVQLLLNILKEKEEEKISPLLVRSSLTSIDKQVSRLTRLMSDLLDLSKIETGVLELHQEQFSLNELIIDAVQDILYTNDRHSINVFHDYECRISADKDRISQVLLNLLSNAIKYSPDSNRIDVWIQKGRGDEVKVKIKDEGIGIDKKEQIRIFERFYRAQGEKEKTYPGFGIGLFLASEIVHRHGGEISVESEKGKGSVFTFTLPCNN